MLCTVSYFEPVAAAYPEREPLTKSLNMAAIRVLQGAIILVTDANPLCHLPDGQGTKWTQQGAFASSQHAHAHCETSLDDNIRSLQKVRSFGRPGQHTNRAGLQYRFD